MCLTILCTTATIRASVAPIARAQFSQVKTPVPDAGPASARPNAACTRPLYRHLSSSSWPPSERKSNRATSFPRIKADLLHIRVHPEYSPQRHRDTELQDPRWSFVVLTCGVFLVFLCASVPLW